MLITGPAIYRAQNSPIRYLLDLRKPASHLIGVTMDVPGAGAGTEFQIPAWNNLYQIRNFVRDVQGVEAQCQGQSAPLRRVDINTWSSDEGCANLEIRYEVYANQDSVFSAILDSRHALLNFALLLFYLPNERQRAVRVKFLLPQDWNLITMLDDGPSPGEYQAPDYDCLVDSPAEAGKFQEYDYVQAGAQYRIAVDGEQDLYSPKRLLKALKKITSTETTLMQDVPFKRYTFLFFFAEKGEGGMEHRDGTAISIPADRMRAGLDTLEVIAAHEFFHLWNVKRIRPQGLEPIDYIRGNDTSDLWFSEGVTSTYAQLALLRSALIDSKQFYAHLAGEIGQLRSRPARNLQSAEESGREAWLEKYPDYSRPERSISYYNKGELLGYLLDLAIRHASDNRYSLDDVMRQLNRDFAMRGRCFSDADLENIVAQMSPAFPVKEFFRSNIDGTGDLDYGKYLGYAGLELKIETKEVPDLGFNSLQAFEGPIQVESLVPGSSAQKAGLQAGDVLLEMNGVQLPVTPDRELIYFKPGQQVVFTVERGTKVLEIAFPLGSKNGLVYQVEEMANPTPPQLAVRAGWLKGASARRR
ncbi:MAG TPA: PDZ domain-containing protein [Terriglobia bacterium]|nr:PDZ domain-containing protein [Terriglobia bacterium]